MTGEARVRIPSDFIHIIGEDVVKKAKKCSSGRLGILVHIVDFLVYTRDNQSKVIIVL